MSDAINMDLQSSMLLETLRQTPSIQDNNHLDSGGSAGDGNAKSASSSSLSSSADGGGGGVAGMNSDGGGSSEKSALEAMDPAILSASAPSGAESPASGSSGSEKSNRTRYSINQLLALRNLEHSKQKPIFMVEPKSEKLARMFSILDRTTDRYGKSLSMGKASDGAYEDESVGGGNGSAGNYGRNRAANGPGGGGNVDGGSGGGGGSRMEMRRSGGMDLRDPKDRLRKEDGIVLSPQRRSFNMGCQMPAAPSANTSGLNIGGSLLRNERDILGGRERRIGSGRILSRDVSWDYRPDKDAPESNDYRASGNANYRERERDIRDIRDTRDSRDSRDSRDRNDRDKDFRKDYDRDRERERDRDREDRFERRPLNRDFDRNDKDSRNTRMSSRYSNSYNSNNDSHGSNNYHSNNYNNHYHSSHHDRRRQYSDHRDEEPEWFSEPTSQTDTIELRGFDDPVSEDETTKSDKEDTTRDDSKQDLLLETKPADKEIHRPSPSLQQQQNDKNNNADGSDLLGRTGTVGPNDKTNANQLLTPTDAASASTAAAAAAKMDRTPGDGASEGSTKSGLGATLGIASTLGQSKINDDDFNFEDFLKLDALPSSLLYPDLPASKDSGNVGGSRFSQWFRQDNTAQAQPSQPSGHSQPQQQPKQQPSHFDDSRRSSLQDELNNMINDFTSTGLDDHIPDTNSNKYFAPISPAATSSNSLMELFQRSEKQLHQQQQQQQQHQQQQQQQHHQPQQQQREREHHPQQQIPQPQPPGHPHGHPLLGHPPNHPGLHHQQHQQQQQQHHQQIQNRNLQQLLGVSGSGNAGNHGPHGPIPPAPSGGQIHSVEELEARFRQSDSEGNNRSAGIGPSIPRLITPSGGGRGDGGAAGGAGGPGHPSNDAQQQEMNAFKKLLAQISENQPHNAQPNPTAHPPHPINMLHHQQQQNELLQKMLHLNQMHHPVNDARQAEILKRPEALALLNGVARGEVSQQHLWQQLTNPSTAQPHREILSSVLGTISTSPRVVSPNILIQPSPGGVPILPPATVPPAAAAVAAAAAANSANLLFQHHSKQQMRLSPLPNGMPQRIPSPRELQYHTQSIMQNALIRKKLEEQRENYRKRQEQQQQQQQNRNQPETSAASSSAAATTTSTTTSGSSSSAATSNNQQSGNQSINSTATSAPAAVVPSSAVSTPVVASSVASPAKQTPPSHSHSQHTSSPTPLAFTPTSVLRKMTAEKETEQLSSNNSSNAPSHSTISSVPPNERPPLGSGGHGQNLLMGLNNPLSQQQQQQQQQRNLAALIGSHPPLQPPHNQPQGPPPQLPHHHMGNAHHPNTMGPQNAQPPQPNHQQMRGGHQAPGMPSGNIPWNLKQPHPGQQMPPMPKPQGRPILKGGNTQQQPPQQQHHPSPMSQMSFASNIEFQQQMQQQFQGRSGNPILGAHQSQQQQQQQMLQQQQPHNQHQNQMNPHLQQLLQQRQQQQQQQRAIRNQHMQQMPPSFRMGPQQQQQQHQSQGTHPHQGQPQPGASGIINYNRDGGLSPTSNQLARWFSPELLAQASAGKLPSLNIGQAMSLEEFERNMQHSSATVHN